MTRVQEILNDPAASKWLKEALEKALPRDPVDAANDAEVLAMVLLHRAIHTNPSTLKR
ncbi:MAG: hypothetical protein AAGJ73_13315 [Pseudomonadota bacterium]